MTKHSTIECTHMYSDLVNIPVPKKKFRERFALWSASDSRFAAKSIEKQNIPLHGKVGDDVVCPLLYIIYD